MFYAIRHFTRYRYSRPVWQSMMEVRMHPRSEYAQRCFTFQLSVSPRARIFGYSDHSGNLIHHFDIPEPHTQLTIIADSLVDVDAPMLLPPSLEPAGWDDLDAMVAEDDYWDMLMPSVFARPAPELLEFAREIGAHERNGHDPLVLLRNVNERLYDALSYVKESTRVDSPIEDALRTRQGVCQDFAHIMIAIVRTLRTIDRKSVV